MQLVTFTQHIEKRLHSAAVDADKEANAAAVKKKQEPQAKGTPKKSTKSDSDVKEEAASDAGRQDSLGYDSTPPATLKVSHSSVA